MRYWVLAGLLVLTYAVQSVGATYMAVRGVMPDLLLVTVVTYGLLFGWQVGLGAGVLAGLLVDLTASRLIGVHVLSLGGVGLLAGLVEEKVFKDNLLLAPIATVLASITSHTIVLICRFLFDFQIDVLGILRGTIFPSALYDMVLSLFVYSRIYKYYLYLRPDPRGTIVIRRR